MDESRIDRIEQKIDKLTDAVMAIVRVEEKLVANDKRVDRLEFRLDEQENDIDTLKEDVQNNSGVTRFADKVFWIVLAGCVSFAFYMARG